ncbi:MAG: hypothetical protein LBR58_01430 [Propionibacteriaceae bacterium]|jgi:hypothetical protein|nr:hypothetical protein [Propionibacteriaceae bacterium]
MHARFVRLIAAWMLLLAASALLTDAAVVGSQTIQVHGNGVRFSIETAAGTRADWQPGPADWKPSSQRVTIKLCDEPQYPLGPGQQVSVRVAARTTAAVPAALIVEARDPDPLGPALDPATGTYLELFDQLHVTVSEAGQTFFDGPATALVGVDLGELAPRPQADSPAHGRLFDLTVSVPESVDNRWQGAATGFQVLLRGVSK